MLPAGPAEVALGNVLRAPRGLPQAPRAAPPPAPKVRKAPGAPPAVLEAPAVRAVRLVPAAGVVPQRLQVLELRRPAAPLEETKCQGGLVELLAPKAEALLQRRVLEEQQVATVRSCVPGAQPAARLPGGAAATELVLRSTAAQVPQVPQALLAEQLAQEAQDVLVLKVLVD